MKLNHPGISTGQGNQLILLLPSAPSPLKSPKRQQNPQSTEKVCIYHPVTANLADLAKNKKHIQNIIMYYQSCS